MAAIEPALTGPSAAGLLRLDGFRDLTWPLRWVATRSAKKETELVRTRRWAAPSEVHGVLVAAPSLVLRHLGDDPDLLKQAAVSDGIAPLDRIELAFEHVLRLRLVTVRELHFRGGSHEGDKALRRVLALHGDQPPTESFAETRGAQLFRLFGWRVWRQMPIVGFHGRIVHRSDFVMPFHVRRRPGLMRPSLGLLIELDSDEFHRNEFEKDHDRQSTYDALGYHWVTFTPNQVERSPKKVRLAVEGAFERAIGSTPTPFVPRRLSQVARNP